MGRMYYGRYCWGLYRALPPFSRLNLKKNEKEGKFEGISSFWVRHDMTQTFTLTIHTQTHLISPSTSWATMHVHFLLISLAACIATAARHQNLRAAEPDVERLIDTINPKGQLLSGNNVLTLDPRRIHTLLRQKRNRRTPPSPRHRRSRRRMALTSRTMFLTTAEQPWVMITKRSPPLLRRKES